MIINDRERKKIKVEIYITLILSMLIVFVSVSTQLYSLLNITCALAGMCFVLTLLIVNPKTDKEKKSTKGFREYLESL